MYALSDIMDHMALLRECHTPFADMSPGVYGLGDCHLKTKRAGTGEYSVRRFLGMEQALGSGELGDFYRSGESGEWPLQREERCGALVARVSIRNLPSGYPSTAARRGRYGRTERMN